MSELFGTRRGTQTGRRNWIYRHCDKSKVCQIPSKIFWNVCDERVSYPDDELKLFRRDESDAARRVADYIEDFSPLRSLSAFQRLESDIKATLTHHGWSS